MFDTSDISASSDGSVSSGPEVSSVLFLFISLGIIMQGGSGAGWNNNIRRLVFDSPRRKKSEIRLRKCSSLVG